MDPVVLPWLLFVSIFHSLLAFLIYSLQNLRQSIYVVMLYYHPLGPIVCLLVHMFIYYKPGLIPFRIGWSLYFLQLGQTFEISCCLFPDHPGYMSEF